MRKPTFELTMPIEPGGAEENEHYPTPPALAAAGYQAVLDLCWVRGGGGERSMAILEPGCGDLAPFLEASLVSPNANRFGCDIRDVRKTPFPRVSIFSELDFLDAASCEARYDLLSKWNFDLIITNPPFSLFTEFVERSLELVAPFGLVAMLMRTDAEGSIKRVEFWKRNPFLVKFNIIPRPAFIGGSSDSREYAFYVFPGPGLKHALCQLGRSWSEVRTMVWR